MSEKTKNQLETSCENAKSKIGGTYTLYKIIKLYNPEYYNKTFNIYN